MAVPTFTRLTALFPPGIDKHTFDFDLGNDSDHNLFVVENSSHDPNEDSLLSLYAVASLNDGPVAGISKPAKSDIALLDRLDLKTAIIVYHPNTHKWHNYVMNNCKLMGHASFLFCMTVKGRDEAFEWRASKGSEIRAVHQHRHAHGFKLVRMGHAGPSGGRGGKRSARQDGESRDGLEIVAVWATHDHHREKKRPFTFQLYGSGAAGELGGEFPLLALMTALKIYSIGDKFMNVPKPKKK
ncbi:hypothetical protein F4821DRAFT_265024 [Hypoxylon rubiginosum]|uniref:Uncharacterized protein n=1 Tax=Hypoxylon rubiginosum TaxID=110542 RepID=A0ACC0CLS4_9PEZI|nr:hypothetical protein F4821DRAFT_265024 [Hypoxylon rubiginosum]